MKSPVSVVRVGTRSWVRTVSRVNLGKDLRILYTRYMVDGTLTYRCTIRDFILNKTCIASDENPMTAFNLALAKHPDKDIGYLMAKDPADYE